jgi:hypothetical protein
VAVGRAAAHERKPDRSREDGEEHGGADGTPAGGALREQERGDGELGERDRDSKRSGEAFRCAEVDGGRPRTRPVGQLPDAGDREDGGEPDAAEQEGNSDQTIDPSGARDRLRSATRRGSPRGEPPCLGSCNPDLRREISVLHRAVHGSWLVILRRAR